MLTIDGTMGEGGGQVLRSSLALSSITQTPFTLTGIRGKRAKGGLGKQHLCSVLAAAEICNAQVTGAFLGSKTISFAPQKVRGGTYTFKVGSAGSALLVLQTVLLPLLGADTPSRVTIFGGTHNQKAPSADFFKEAFLPLLLQMGAQIAFSCERLGFYPVGGGKITVDITPSKLVPITLVTPGTVQEISALAVSAHRPLSHLTSQAQAIGAVLPQSKVELRDVTSAGHGGAVMISVKKEHTTQLFTGFSKREVPPKITAQVVAEKARDYARAHYALDTHLTDQILLPMALAGGGSFSCDSPSLHSTTNAQVLALFTPYRSLFEPLGTHYLLTLSSQ